MPLPPKLSSMIPTQQSKVMNRKARMVVERDRGEDNVGNNNFDNDDIGKAGGGEDDNNVRCTRRGRDDRNNNQKVREVRGEEEDGCDGGRNGGRGAGGDNEVEIPNEVTGGRGAHKGEGRCS